MEGIWTSAGYKVGIKKRDNSYIGFIISSQNESWKPLEVKLKLDQDGKSVYYMGNHSQIADTFSVVKNSIIFFNNNKIAFIKEFPAPPLSKKEIAADVNELEGFYLKPISDKTLFLKIAGLQSLILLLQYHLFFSMITFYQKILEQNRCPINLVSGLS